MSGLPHHHSEPRQGKAPKTVRFQTADDSSSGSADHTYSNTRYAPSVRNSASYRPPQGSTLNLVRSKSRYRSGVLGSKDES